MKSPREPSRPDDADQTLPEDLVDALQTATRVAVLTGAGISAESGIPTFRDALTGLWAKQDPMKLASPEGFARDPALVWQWYQWRRELISQSTPNAGHRALAELATSFDKFTLITQNVDGFHQLAGSKDVLELHGNIARSICSTTRRTIDQEWIERHRDQNPPPSPYSREGLARPDVVWFGEALDEKTLKAAFAAAADCELMLVVGTAGAVHPAATLPSIARQSGAEIVEINPDETELSHLTRWRLRGPASFWLPKLQAGLIETA